MIRFFLRLTALVVTSIACLGAGSQALAAVYLDLTAVTEGGAGVGGFTGTLDGVGVTGAILLGEPEYQTTKIGLSYLGTTIDGSSPQYSHAGVYTPTVLSTDKVGYAKYSYAYGTAILLIRFDSPITDLAFHVANLDKMTIDFSPSDLTAGDVTRLSGNSQFEVAGTILHDIDPMTAAHWLESDSPVNAPSAYGSVRLNGTFSSVTIKLAEVASAPWGDGGSFTLSGTAAPTVSHAPEPSALIIWSLLGVLGIAIGRWRRKRQA